MSPRAEKHASCPLFGAAESSARSENFYEVDVPVKGHKSLSGMGPSLQGRQRPAVEGLGPCCARHAAWHGTCTRDLPADLAPAPRPLRACFALRVCRVAVQHAVSGDAGGRQPVPVRLLWAQGEGGGCFAGPGLRARLWAAGLPASCVHSCLLCMLGLPPAAPHRSLSRLNLPTCSCE